MMYGLNKELKKTPVKVVLELSPVQWDEVKKSMVLVCENFRPHTLQIADSKIVGVSTAQRRLCYSIDLSERLRPGIYAGFHKIADQLASIRSIKGNSNVILFERERDYCFASDGDQVVIGKAPVKNRIGLIPTGMSRVGEEINIFDCEEMLSKAKHHRYIDLLFFDEQLLAFRTPMGGLHLFDAQAADQCFGSHPDLILRSTQFLKTCGTVACLNIHRQGDRYWLQTSTNIGKPKRKGAETALTSEDVIRSHLYVTTWESVSSVNPSRFQAGLFGQKH